MITKYVNYCSLCGSPATEVHHLVLGNSLRKLAEQDGLKMPLCNNCHDVIHRGNQQANALSRICGQLLFEKNLIEKEGVTSDEAREKFRARYGRSYL